MVFILDAMGQARQVKVTGSQYCLRLDNTCMTHTYLVTDYGSPSGYRYNILINLTNKTIVAQRGLRIKDAGWGPFSFKVE
jgi:hypothetical protein